MEMQEEMTQALDSIGAWFIANEHVKTGLRASILAPSKRVPCSIVTVEKETGIMELQSFPERTTEHRPQEGPATAHLTR
jgi:hypothetical protein